MSMNAVVPVRVSLERAREVLGAAEAPAGVDAPPRGSWLKGAQGPLCVVALDDGFVVHTGVPMREAEPAQIAMLMRIQLDAVLDEHEDERGLLVVPERALPEASTYDALVAEAADFGDWVVVPEAEAAAPGNDDLAAMMGQVMGSMGDPSQMQGLWEQAQKAMSDPAMQEKLMGAAEAMMGRMQQGGGNLDLDALAAEAQKLVSEDPELAEQLKEQLGSEPGEGEQE